MKSLKNTISFPLLLITFSAVVQKNQPENSDFETGFEL